MNAKTADRRREAYKEVHSALEALLPSLEIEEMGQLAADLSALAGRTTLLLKVLCFARTMAEDPGGGETTAPPERLVGDGH